MREFIEGVLAIVFLGLIIFACVWAITKAADERKAWLSNSPCETFAVWETRSIPARCINYFNNNQNGKINIGENQ